MIGLGTIRKAARIDAWHIRAEARDRTERMSI
jgi:hypothetical protein